MREKAMDFKKRRGEERPVVKALIKAARRPLKSLKTSSTVLRLY